MLPTKLWMIGYEAFYIPDSGHQNLLLLKARGGEPEQEFNVTGLGEIVDVFPLTQFQIGSRESQGFLARLAEKDQEVSLWRGLIIVHSKASKASCCPH